ncbi:16S rRNA (cytosine(1402)-N(4))-methyltransferase RsmH [Nitrincola alkalilacustris]|uniref:16S rRNA (cytosine(1402)-N(4))-methyltransferase RsmH n=1 Tax=Nitrincola alkalilacustris TaxID=1571224 RepID=UPI00124CF789|nr:16S rRNA (cytosine(1402)-N(4))-methyltransferase RsmH [Nitrincola alkalilacustris]
MSNQYSHTTVLLEEAVAELIVNRSGFYVDGTFGRGGHARRILAELESDGRLLAIDKDLQALSHAQAVFEGEQRFVIEHGSFARLQEFVQQHGSVGKVDGVLLDLGVSSPQLDDPERGFSFAQDGPLDMRMDTTVGESAAQWINRASEKEIADVMYTYGEERFSRRMAKAIVEARQQSPIMTTGRLAQIITDANPRWEKGKNPATRAFQGIRIFINHELDDLEQCLEQALEVLAIGGKLVVISFHSLEDRIVKRFIRKHVKGNEHLPEGMPYTDEMLRIRLKASSKAIKPSQAEVNANPRARSAVMRAAVKCA